MPSSDDTASVAPSGLVVSCSTRPVDPVSGGSTATGRSGRAHVPDPDAAVGAAHRQRPRRRGSGWPSRRRRARRPGSGSAVRAEWRTCRPPARATRCRRRCRGRRRAPDRPRSSPARRPSRRSRPCRARAPATPARRRPPLRTTRVASSRNVAAVTGPGCGSSATRRRDGRSTTRRPLSELPNASRRPSGLNATVFTQVVGPVSGSPSGGRARVGDVPEADGAVRAARGERAAVRAERDRVDLAGRRRSAPAGGPDQPKLHR